MDICGILQCNGKKIFYIHSDTQSHKQRQIQSDRSSIYLLALTHTQTLIQTGLVFYNFISSVSFFPILLSRGHINDAWGWKCHPQNKKEAILLFSTFCLSVCCFAVVKGQLKEPSTSKWWAQERHNSHCVIRTEFCLSDNWLISRNCS